MTIKQNASLLFYQRCLSVNQLSYFFERTLARLDLLRVERPALEVGEPELGRRGLIAVGRAQHHLHAQMLDAPAGLRAPVVRRPVQDHDDLLAPPGPVLGSEGGCQLRQEHLHDVLLRVALRLSQPDWSLGRDSHDDVDLVPQHSVHHRVGATAHVPATAPEVGLWHPGLVDVDHMLPFAVDLQHFASVEVAQHLAPL